MYNYKMGDNITGDSAMKDDMSRVMSHQFDITLGRSAMHNLYVQDMDSRGMQRQQRGSK